MANRFISNAERIADWLRILKEHKANSPEPDPDTIRPEIKIQRPLAPPWARNDTPPPKT